MVIVGRCHLLRELQEDASLLHYGGISLRVILNASLLGGGYARELPRGVFPSMVVMGVGGWQLSALIPHMVQTGTETS